MQRKTFFIVLPVFTLLVLTGALVILWQSDPQEVPLDEAAGLRTDGENRNHGSIVESTDTARELITPMTEATLDEEEMPASYRKALGVIRGRLVEEDGSPVPDRQVEIFGMSVHELFRDGASLMKEDVAGWGFRTGSTRSGEDGVFELAELYPRAFYVLGIDLKGPRVTSRFLDSMPGPGELLDLGDIELAPYAIVTGRAVDEDGLPVVGARVRTTELPPVVFISGAQDFRDGCSFLIRAGREQMVIQPPEILERFIRFLPFPETTTAADGTFRLEGATRGLLTVVVDRLGYATARHGPVSTARGGEHDLGDITLGNGVTIEGKVVDHEEKPVPGAEVRIGPIHGFPEMAILQAPVFTDDQGAFTFPGGLPMSTFAAARRYDTDPWTVVGPFDPRLEPPLVVLPPAYDLRLIVTRSDGSVPKGIRLKIHQEFPFGGMMNFEKPRSPQSRMTSPEEGVLQLTGLPQGKYALLVSATGCGLIKEVVTIQGEAVAKEVVLEPALEADIRVLTDKASEPVEWAEVYAVRGDDEAWMNPTRLSRSRTDTEGLARLHNLAPGEYNLTVSHPKYAVTGEVVEIPSDKEIVVLLKPGGILKGVVHNGGSTHEAPYMISLNLDNGSFSPEAMTPRFTATDLEGHFTVTNLEPGEWEVNVLKRLLDKDPMGLGEVLRLGPLMSSEVEIWSEETSFVELNLGTEDLGPCGTVSGRIYLNNVPAQGTLVSLRSGGKRIEDTVDETGNYNLGRIPVGKRYLRIASLPGAMGQYDLDIYRQVEVQEDQPLFEDFTLYTGSVNGRVVYESDGAPVAGTRVSMRISDEDAPYSVSIRTVTGLDGRFVFEGVPVGTYTVRADERKFASTPVTGVKVYPGGRSSSVTLMLLTPIIVQGRVELPETVKEARWLGLLFRSVDGDSDVREWVRLDSETGTFETSGLIPGSYDAELFGGLEMQFKPMRVDVPATGLTGLVLYPEEKVEDEG